MTLKHTALIFLTASLGCAEPKCIDADCALDPADPTESLGAGLTEAKAIMNEAGAHVRTDELTRLQHAIDTRPDHCDIVAIMAVRWGYGFNDFDGFILSPSGSIRASTDGRFAPVRPQLGVFAGSITVGDNGTDPVVTEPPGVTDEDRMKPDAEPSDGTQEPPPLLPHDEPSESTISLGGSYSANQTFSGTAQGTHGTLPVVGIWTPVDQHGGIAIGVFVDSSDDDSQTQGCVTLDNAVPEDVAVQ